MGVAVRGSARRHAAIRQTLEGARSGVSELIEDHRGDTYRAVYTVRINDSVHVLHAFQKKSKSGIETPKPDVDLIERRLKAVLGRHRVRDRS